MNNSYSKLTHNPQQVSATKIHTQPDRHRKEVRSKKLCSKKNLISHEIAPKERIALHFMPREERAGKLILISTSVRILVLVSETLVVAKVGPELTHETKQS